MINKVALMGNAFRSVMGMNAVYGFDIAVDEAYKSILTYSKAKEFLCLYEPGQFQEMAIKRKLRAISRENLKTHMISEYDAVWKGEKTTVDVLHSISMDFLPLYNYRDRCMLNTPPITYTIHGASYPEYIQNFYLMQLLAPVQPYDSLICTSTSVKKVVQNILERMSLDLLEKKQIKLSYNGRLDVIPLGVDTDHFKPMDQMEARQQLNIPPNKFVMLWLGRLSAFDKADLYPLLIVFRRLLKKNNDLLLVLAGHDRTANPHLPSLKQYVDELGITEHVVFMQDYNVMKRNVIFSAADIFTSPIDNLQETFGLTPIEAMACGIPQVVSDFDGYKDTVCEGVTGFKIPTVWTKCDTDIQTAGLLPCDMEHRLVFHHLLTAQSVALDLDCYESRIQLLIDNPDLKRQMGENSRERALSLYQWKHVVDQYDALWEELSHIEKMNNQAKESGLISFLEPHYFQDFNVYVSEIIDVDSELLITEEGKEIIEGKLSYVNHYEEEEALLETGVAWQVLQAISMQQDNITIENLVEQYQQYSIDVVKRAAMKLVKQGFVAIHRK
ncbi:glycosyltransferase family 4 protein [Paenibacillus sp. EKM211P]|uniref:glycosyltransferase family 4 protein n=1 Tax=Paenibacillus sp. EKM211P TaxID=1683679 RepID=UPI0013E9001F|nr:glycosyltransferase family 4 protein [Paenibacillus sp. EKM211P]KAF6582678.1 glycosyltransferase family 4 protein [Paenibacillus sp. EKM211P]